LEAKQFDIFINPTVVGQLFCHNHFAVYCLLPMMKNNAAGFTTVELLVALQIAFLVAGFVYAAYLTASQLATRWRQKVDLESAAMLCLHPMIEEIVKAKQIMSADATELTLLNYENRQLEYRFENYRLYRNQQPITSHQAPVLALRFRYARADTAEVTWPSSSSPLFYFQPKTVADHANIALVEVEMVLGNGKAQFQIKTTAHPRRLRQNLFELL
jgi:Tfp pilus assembly protein PilE